MTPEQIEVAARKLCELRSVDYDFLARYSEQRKAAETADFYYKIALSEIREENRKSQIQQAIKYAQEQQCTLKSS